VKQIIRVVDLAYVRFRVTDPARMETFLLDFGLHVSGSEQRADTDVAWYRGSGSSPCLVAVETAPETGFIGPAFLVESEDDLHRVADAFETSGVRDRTGPGGGRHLTMIDPDGYQLEFVYGMQSVDELPARQPLVTNTSGERQRVGTFQRVDPGPAHVRRIGHLILRVDDYPAALAFYQQFGFLVSDEVHDPDDPGHTLNGFLRCDRGTEWTDHHTLGLAIRVPKALDHVAFECTDIDDIVQGGLHLESQGYRRSWGVGRHILGSQIFDYWRDPHGFKFEHWTDGDLLNVDTPSTRVPAGDGGPGAISQWGSTPDEFRRAHPGALSIGPYKDA